MSNVPAGAGGERQVTRRPVAARPAWARWAYVGVTLGITGIVLAGFWPSYYGRIASGTVTRPLVVHAHGAVFAGWLGLLLAQAGLVATGRVALHRRVGQLGMAYGVLVLVMGLVISFAAPVLHMRAGEMSLDGAAESLLYTLVDMLLFAGFFGAAMAFRRRPALHRRLILGATVVLAFAAVGRMALPWPAQLVLWLSPLLAAMALDVRTQGHVHPVLPASVAILTVAFSRIFVAQSEGWLRIGRVIMGPFL